MAGWQDARERYHEGDYEGARDGLVRLSAHNLDSVRYLAAAHYRLGEYAEALAVLDKARRDFPAETGLVPQYARTLERAGRWDEARAQWEALLHLDPGHATALRALRRLSRASDKDTCPATAAPANSESGLEIPRVVRCPRCGAHKGLEEPQCWRCGHALVRVGAFRRLPRLPEPWQWAPEAMVVLAALAALGCAGLIAMDHAAQSHGPALSPATAAQKLLYHGLWRLRMAAGLAFLVLWPIALSWLAQRRGQTSPRTRRKGLAGGLFLGAAAILGLWMPLPLWPRMAAILCVLVLLVQAWVGPKRMAAVFFRWAGQMALLAAVFTLAALPTVGWRFLSEFNVIAGYAAQARWTEEELAEPDFEGPLPLLTWVRWQSTGSQWIDERAFYGGFIVQTREDAPISRMRVLRGLETVREAKPDASRWGVRFIRPKPGERYEICIEGPPGAQAQVRVISPLPFEGGETHQGVW